MCVCFSYCLLQAVGYGLVLLDGNLVNINKLKKLNLGRIDKLFRVSLASLISLPLILSLPFPPPPPPLPFPSLLFPSPYSLPLSPVFHPYPFSLLLLSVLSLNPPSGNSVSTLLPGGC